MEAKVRKSIPVYKDFFGRFDQKKAEINQKWPKIEGFRAILNKN
jgi:hypothetical protein